MCSGVQCTLYASYWFIKVILSTTTYWIPGSLTWELLACVSAQGCLVTLTFYMGSRDWTKIFRCAWPALLPRFLFILTLSVLCTKVHKVISHKPFHEGLPVTTFFCPYVIILTLNYISMILASCAKTSRRNTWQGLEREDNVQ